jgi:hypothetical protein
MGGATCCVSRGFRRVRGGISTCREVCLGRLQRGGVMVGRLLSSGSQWHFGRLRLAGGLWPSRPDTSTGSSA